MANRDSSFSNAGVNRSKHIISTLNDEVEVISLSIPRRFGIFSSKKYSNITNLDFRTIYFYPFCISIPIIKHISILISILMRMIFKVKNGDKIILYNAHIHYVVPLFILRTFKRFDVVYEIEELYHLYDKRRNLKGFVYKIIEKYLLKNANSYILVNEHMTKYINNRPYIIDFGYLTEIDTDSLLDEKIILYSGRLDVAGGIDLFLESTKYFMSILKQYKVIVTGDGPYKEKVLDFIESNKELHIEYLGLVDEEFYKNILSSVSICVNPRKVNEKISLYSFPSKILTYLSTGSKIVTSCNSEIKKLTYLFENLYCYDIDSPRILAETILDATKVCTDKKSNVKKFKNYFIKQKEKLRRFIND